MRPPPRTISTAPSANIYHVDRAGSGTWPGFQWRRRRHLRGAHKEACAWEYTGIIYSGGGGSGGGGGGGGENSFHLAGGGGGVGGALRFHPTDRNPTQRRRREQRDKTPANTAGALHVHSFRRQSAEVHAVCLVGEGWVEGMRGWERRGDAPEKDESIDCEGASAESETAQGTRSACKHTCISKHAKTQALPPPTKATPHFLWSFS